jgi:hypothetical protein
MTIFQGDPGPDKLPRLPEGGRATAGTVFVVGATLPRLDDALPVYTPVGSDFRAVTANTLGNVATGNDGFDALMAAPAATVDADHDAVHDVSVSVAAADFNPGDAASALLTPVEVETAAFIAGGDGLFSSLISFLGL